MPIADKAAAATQPQVVSGPAGIGKTQIALEYAYRYCDEYEAVLWAHADSREILAADFASIAEALGLPERSRQNQSVVVDAVKRWLQTTVGWLLILDNVSDVKMVRDFLPVGGRGHILMTARVAVPRTFALNIEISKLKPEDEALFLLRRAGILPVGTPVGAASGVDRRKARELSEALDGFPLALDLAGAYIREVQCSLVSYLNLYRQEKARVRGESDCFGAVATSVAISMERIERDSAAAAELLRLCAFLHPDDIPEQVFIDGASELGPILGPIARDRFELSKAIRGLCKYSLVWRNLNNSMLTAHRLIQDVLRVSMSREVQHQWAQRTVRTVEQALPRVEPAEWRCYHGYLAQMQSCATLIEQWNMKFPEAASLLEHAGDYLHMRMQYEQAEPLLRHAVTIREKLLGPDHPDFISFLNRLALFYSEQNKYVQAESLYERVVELQEKILGPGHPDVAQSLNDLAVIFREQGKWAQAESLFQRVLEIRKKVLGPEHPEVATVLHNLGMLYRMQGKYTQAEPLFQRALAMRERVLGPEHPEVAQISNALAGLYRAQGRYEQAEHFYQRALTISERGLGSEHPDLATTLNNLALLYHDTGKFAEAESCYRWSLAIFEGLLGSEHPYVASCLDNLAVLYHDRGEYEQAETLYQRALTIREKVLGLGHPYVAVSLNNLATLYTVQGKYNQAKVLFKRAVAISEQALGPNHPDLAQLLENYAALLQKMKEIAKALEVRNRANVIWSRHAQENPRGKGR